MSYIKKIRLHNFKIFNDLEIDTDRKLVILIGENGVGKSTVLEAIQLVLTGSHKLIESIGINNLINLKAVDSFLNSKKNVRDLPIVRVELFLNEDLEDDTINGIHYELVTSSIPKNGISLTLKPDVDIYYSEIIEILEKTNLFPFEYYKTEFKTFSGKSYTSFSKTKSIYKHKFIRNLSLSYKRGMKEYIKGIYESSVDEPKRKFININFREQTSRFIEDNLRTFSDINFQFEHENENSFQNNLTIYENGININNFGHGEKLLLNIESDLISGIDNTVVLLEEPETHLSYLNMHKLIDVISNSTNEQIFVTTHSNMIAARLGLNNLIMLGNAHKVTLNDISEETATFFAKSANTNLLNFILSDKVILVEGNAEYILMDYLYQKITFKESYKDNIAIISCGGKTFKRYIEIGILVNKKIAVITDNDNNPPINVIKSFLVEGHNNINAFTDMNIENNTLEVSLYHYNQKLFEKRLKTNSMSKGLLSFMLENKTESAYRILTKIEPELIVVPNYIEDAIKWIRE